MENEIHQILKTIKIMKDDKTISEAFQDIKNRFQKLSEEDKEKLYRIE